MITNSHSHLPKPEPYQRHGSGDGEREASMTRQMPFEPLPASVLLNEAASREQPGLGAWGVIESGVVWVVGDGGGL